jgi:hypothetical protein
MPMLMLMLLLVLFPNPLPLYIFPFILEDFTKRKDPFLGSPQHRVRSRFRGLEERQEC